MRARAMVMMTVWMSFAASTRLCAQTLSGHILDNTTGAPISGALVRLNGADGSRVAQWLTNEAGLYRVTAVASGRYVIRIERLGFRTFESLPFAIDSLATRDFRLPMAAVELPAIVATSGTRCVRHDAMSAESSVVWDEIRKALDVASWTAGNAPVEFEIVDRMRWYDPMMRQRQGGSREVTTGSHRGSPFAALESDSLLAKGFIQKADSGHFAYFGPDAALIASDAFQSTHCFRERTGSKHKNLIGLSFESTGDIKPYDVRGTLWIDRTSGLLTNLEYTYNKLPVDAPLQSAGGTVEFTRCANGMWLVSGWKLRVPIVRPMQTPGGLRNSLSDIQEKSEFVLSAKIDGKIVYIRAEPDR